MTTVLRNKDFDWDGLALYRLGRRVLTLLAEAKYPHLYRIRYPNGWTSSPANLTRAKDAAYGHARFLMQETGVEAVYSPETVTLAGTPDRAA
jgi:hypothetical protein